MYNPWQKLAGLIMGLREKNCSFREGLNFRGSIKLEFFNKNGVLINCIEDKNFIVDLGLETVVDILEGTTTTAAVGNRIYRMAIGDDGTLTGQPYVPKVPDATWPARTTLFHEVLRQSRDTATQPTSTSMRFVTSFASADITPSSFTSSPYVINEAALIISDGTQTTKDEIEQGYTPDSSESMFSIRTFKSQPFDPADTLTLTVTWTIFVQ